MDSELEFREINQKEMELIRSYRDVETNFIAAKGFYDVPRNTQLRSHAVSTIAKCYKLLSKNTAQPDAFIPYLAVNFFDRFITKHKNVLQDVEASTETERLRLTEIDRLHLIAYTCFILSAKLRNEHFSAEEFWNQLQLGSLTPDARMGLELLILGELKWELQPLTAFTFLNYYYSYFKQQFSRFYRRSIYEILLQAQGDNNFVHYNPSLVAFSAFFAASKLAYPEKYNTKAHIYVLSHIGSEDQVEQCMQYMVELCNKMKIKIETPPESGTGSTSSNVVAVPQEEIKGAGTSEENEEEWSGLIKRVQDMGKRKACRVQVLEDLKKMKTKGGKAKHGEKPHLFKNRKRISSIYWIFTISVVFFLCCNGSQAYYYDYFKLAEQWHPGFCKQHGDCHTHINKERFTVHGLWVENSTKTPKPDGIPPPCPNLPNALSKNMRRDWPSLYRRNEELWKLQWAHHGQFSDLDCLEYYKQGLFFHKNCDVKKALEESNIHPSSDLINTNFFKNQLTPKIGVPELQCNGEDLIEVRCCFERNGMRTNCPQTSGHCREELKYLPVPTPTPPVEDPHTCPTGDNSLP